MAAIELAYTLTPGDLWRAGRAVDRQRPLRSVVLWVVRVGFVVGWALLVSAILGRSLDGTARLELWAICTVLAGGLVSLLWWWQLRTAARTLGALRATVDDEGIRLVAANASTRAEWSSYDRWLETPDAFVVLTRGPGRRRSYTPLVKRALRGPDEADRLRGLLREHVGQAPRTAQPAPGPSSNSNPNSGSNSGSNPAEAAGDAIEVAYTLTTDEMAQAIRVRQRNRPADRVRRIGTYACLVVVALIAVALVVGAATGQATVSEWLEVTGLLALVLVVFWLVRAMPRLVAGRLARAYGEQRVTIDDTGLTTVVRSQVTHSDWERFGSWAETRDAFVVLSADRTRAYAWVLPKRVLDSGRSERLRGLLDTRVRGSRAASGRAVR